MSDEPDLSKTLTVLRPALGHVDIRIRRSATWALQHKGRNLSAEQADDYERQVDGQPGDLALRIVLLASYDLKK
jgi:hypothetical protein